MEMFEAIFSGELPPPPIGDTLDFVPIHMEPGAAIFQGRPQRRHYNPMGTVHGGWFATLLDSAVGCAVRSMLPTGKGYTTLELKVNILCAVRAVASPPRYAPDGRKIDGLALNSSVRATSGWVESCRTLNGPVRPKAAVPSERNGMMTLRNRLFRGRHLKLQVLLFGIVACCLTVFLYGLIMYLDAPYKPCVDGPYCGKTGKHHSYQTYESWKQWEGVLFVCWPFGLLASYGLRRLRKQPT
jgi:hypothetical protein